MDIKRNCALSPLIDHNNQMISTPPSQLSSIFSFESAFDNTYALNFTPIKNMFSSEKTLLLDEQIDHITSELSIQSQNLFTTTYTSLQTILSQMQLKLAMVFLQETEYLQSREQQLQFTEQSLTKRMEQLKNLRNERRQLENEFQKLQDQLETAVIHVMKFQTEGEEVLRTFLNQSHQLDEQLSSLICECLASLNRSRTMINSKINEFSHQSNQIQSELTARQTLMHTSQFSIASMLELVNILHQSNVRHSEDVRMSTIHFEKRFQQLTDVTEMTKTHRDINKELNEVYLLEKEKRQLEDELLEQIILLENINTIVGKVIIS